MIHEIVIEFIVLKIYIYDFVQIYDFSSFLAEFN